MDISIILPSIRYKNWNRFYQAASLACIKYKWELIIVGPQNPFDFMHYENIQYIHSFANPTVCFQIGALLARGNWIFNTTDDAILLPNSLDDMYDLWHKNDLQKFDIVNGRYREGVLDANTLEPLTDMPAEYGPEYWVAGTHDSLKLPGINPNWKTALHFFMLTNTYYEIGGIDCNRYEYSAYPMLEMDFRLQELGGKIIDSEKEVSWCSHLPCKSGDHGPVHDAMTFNDEPFFKFKFSHTDMIKHMLYLDYNSWKYQPAKWERRFR